MNWDKAEGKWKQYKGNPGHQWKNASSAWAAHSMKGNYYKDPGQLETRVQDSMEEL